MRRANAASIAMLLLLPFFISQNPAQASASPSLTLQLNTDKTTYYLHEDVQATTRLLNDTTPILGASVTLETTFPNGTTWFVWHNSTDENGHATFTFRLENCPQGEYTIYATAYQFLFGNASATTKFTANIPETQPPNNGTLIVKTTPISAQVFVNAVLWGLSPQNRTVRPGTYTVSYGDVEGFYTPAEEIVAVTENSTRIVEGIYQAVPVIELPNNGTLVVKTTPTSAQVFVNGVLWGLSPQNRTLEPGAYTVSFGDVEGFFTPAAEAAIVIENSTTTIEGIYQSIPAINPPSNGTLLVKTSPMSARVFVNGALWGLSPQSRKLKPGMYTVSYEEVEGFSTLNNATATVYENQTTTVEGIYQPMPGTTLIANPDLVNNTNPFIINATEAGVYLKIYSISDPVVIIIRSLTEPVDHLVPEGWTMLGNYVQITVNNTNVSVNATLYIHYDKDDLGKTQLEENELKIHFWNTTTNGCCQVETSVDENAQYAWASIDHFST